ncbi:MAG TPA: hypothetical protein VH637_14155 [Streptosporangiaceae bacterium]
MTEPPSAAGRRAAARYLAELLLRPGRYRRLWEKYAERTRPGEINQLAVAEALAHHLWDFPRAASDADVLPRQLKDTVARALSGRLLSRSTLTLFIDTFGFGDEESSRLWRMWQGTGGISVLSGPRAMPSDKMAQVAAVLGPRRHQTVSMHDHVFTGEDGRLARTRTLQVVEAVAEGLDRIPYLYDTNTLALEVGQGCRQPSGPLYQIRDGVFAIDIPLTKTLAQGETLTLEYWTVYHYPGNLDDPQECEFRRATLGRLENFDMRVQFHPGKLPAAIWWSAWDGVDGDIIESEAVTPDSQHSVHRYMRFLERTVVGFRWSWCGQGPPGR